MPERRRPRHEPEPQLVERDEAEIVPEHHHDDVKSAPTVLMVFAVVAVLMIAYLGYMQYRSDKRQDAVERYIAEAKALRDKQNAAVNDRINDAVCAILDRLPAGPLLDPIREDYDCGPGLTPASLSEDEVAEIMRDYGPASLARTPGEFYELFPADPLGTGIPAPQYGAVPTPNN